jgi:hypothetical protein
MKISRAAKDGSPVSKAKSHLWVSHNHFTVPFPLQWSIAKCSVFLYYFMRLVDTISPNK